MQIQQWRKTLQIATIRGFFNRLDGTYTVIKDKGRRKKHSLLSPANESTPEETGIDTLLNKN